MSDSDKKKGRSFSLSDNELALIEARAVEHGFKDRNEYLLALVEADIAIPLEIALIQKRPRLRAPGHKA